MTRIEQALYGPRPGAGYGFLGQSAGIAEAMLPELEAVCTKFGERPHGAACPSAVFAVPMGRDLVAVVTAADLGGDDVGRPGAMAFRLLLVPLALYQGLDADPFAVAERFPPDPGARGELSALEWTTGPRPPRTVADLRAVLDTDAPTTQTLLGSAQIVLDGGRVVFESAAPEPRLVRGLWALLPSSTRAELRVADYAFGNAHGFDVLASPSAKGAGLEHHTDGRNAGDAPEGRYELALQSAVESDDQASLDALLARRSRRQMLRLGLGLLAVFLVVPLVVQLIPLSPAKKGRPDKKEPPPAAKQEAPPKGKAALKLPDAGSVPAPTADEVRALDRRVAELARAVGSEDDLLAVERKVASRYQGDRDPGDLSRLPGRLSLMALAWKYGDDQYADPSISPPELLERLAKRWADLGALSKGGDDE